ncbi:GIY-YIG nuclease family protein [Lamprobacter modestohalophilus]|uniref:GIY-YIG nuclease family protein n=1 Tax=Lamprobacter modestohalophilus TaxID=1064514 RepID=UPI003D18ABB4
MGTSYVKPTRLWTRAEVLGPQSPVPREPGLYTWYFRNLPPSVPVQNCRRFDDLSPLYVGMAPKPPPKNRACPSKQTLLDRVRDHCRGNAEGSTPRLRLDRLLALRAGAPRSVQLRNKPSCRFPSDARFSARRPLHDSAVANDH